MSNWGWAGFALAGGALLLILLKIQHSRRLKDAVQTFALIALPVILGVSSYQVQESIATAGLRKDYLQLAIDILGKEPPEKGTGVTPLRCWAVAIVVEYTPIALTNGEKSELVQGSFADGFGAGFSPESFDKGCPPRS